MSKHLDPSGLGSGSFDQANPKARGAADAHDPRIAWDGSEQTAYQKGQLIAFGRQAETIRSKAQKDVGATKLAIEQVASPLDTRGILNSTMSDVEGVFQTAEPELEVNAAEVADAFHAKLEFASRENRTPNGEIDYALHPDTRIQWSIGGGLLFTEASFIATFLGPFTPGGRVQAFAYAAAGSLILGALSAGVGYFGLRAWWVTNTFVRYSARVTVGVGILLILAVLTFIGAYRTSLESGRPISQWLVYASPDALWLISVSVLIVSATIWKARGGNALGLLMPWGTYWQESDVDRRYQLAMIAFETAVEHHRKQIIDGVYRSTTDALMETVAEAEQQLNSLRTDATDVAQRVLLQDQAVRDLRTETKADLDLYGAAVRQERANAVIAEVALGAPSLPDAKGELEAALVAAEVRLVNLRHAVSDIDRPLMDARAEAITRLDRMCRKHLDLAFESKGLPVEEENDA